MKVLVECTVQLEVEISDDIEDPYFLIEDNGCPGTGSVGAALDAAMNHGEENSVCWACNLKGTNKILSIDRP